MLSKCGIVAAGMTILLTGAQICAGQDGKPERKNVPATRLLELPQELKQAPAAPLPGPRIGLSQDIWDFGRVWFGDPCQTEIQIMNGGDQPLKLLDIQTSCGCTLAKPKKRELAPGETAALTVTYDTKKNKKQVAQRITIKSNDPKRPEAYLLVRGEVWNVFDGDPDTRLYLGQMLDTTKKSGSITLTNNLEQPVYPVLQPPAVNAPFEVNLEEIEPGQKYRLSATTHPPLKMGANSINVVLETGFERLPTMTIPVSAVALERVSLMPTRLPVYDAQSKMATRTVRVNFMADHPLKITDAKCSNPAIMVFKSDKPETTPGLSIFSYYSVRVALPAWKDLPEERAWVEIYTDDSDPKFQKLVVPIEKIVPRSGANATPRVQPAADAKEVVKP